MPASDHSAASPPADSASPMPPLLSSSTPATAQVTSGAELSPEAQSHCDALSEAIFAVMQLAYDDAQAEFSQAAKSAAKWKCDPLIMTAQDATIVYNGHGRSTVEARAAGVSSPYAIAYAPEGVDFRWFARVAAETTHGEYRALLGPFTSRTLCTRACERLVSSGVQSEDREQPEWIHGATFTLLGMFARRLACIET